MNTHTKQLNDVMIIRPIIIVLLVLMHSFAMYGGSWKLPEGIHSIRAYFWIQKISFSFMLEMFVFISGYLFAFQIFELEKQFSFKNILISKFKRLIIPSIVFSILYSIFFYNKSHIFFRYIYDIINGLGHMWFLPMLFWCFIFTYLINKIKLKEKIKLFLLLGVAMLSFLPLPFQIGPSLYYLLFFNIGSYFWNNKEKIIKKYGNPRFLIIGLIVFLFLFILLTLFIENISGLFDFNIIHKLIKVSLLNISKLIYSILGLFLFYIFINYLIEKKNIKTTLRFVQFNKLCFGIYIFQQFVLLFLYYNTSVPELLGSFWLPWVGFIITMIISIILTKISIKTKVGRFLIG